MKCPHCGADGADNLTFDYASGLVSYNGRTCRLTTTRILILEHLVDAGSIGISKGALYDSVYVDRAEAELPNERVLDVHFTYMRRAFKKAGMALNIKSNHSRIYASHRVYLVREMPSDEGVHGTHFMKQGDEIYAAV